MGVDKQGTDRAGGSANQSQPPIIRVIRQQTLEWSVITSAPRSLLICWFWRPNPCSIGGLCIAKHSPLHQQHSTHVSFSCIYDILDVRHMLGKNGNPRNCVLAWFLRHSISLHWFYVKSNVKNSFRICSKEGCISGGQMF